MGACCEPSDTGDVSVLRDLPAPDTTGISDRYTVWEYRTPFRRTAFLPFKNAVNAAEEECGGEGFVTLSALAKQLSTPAWAGLDDENSVIAGVLLSDEFKNPKKGHQADQIDKDYLMIFGLINCIDKRTPMEKARGFYEVLQEGGFERHEQISAGDKDFEPAFDKILALATVDLMGLANLKGVEYSDDDKDALREAFADVREDWLDTVYDVSSTLVNSKWLEKVVSPQANYIFDGERIRKIAFEKAKVAAVHIK